MNLSRKALIAVGVGLSATALAIGPALPAPAATPAGWHLFFSHHYGAPSVSSGYFAVTALSKRDAWAGGGTNLTGPPTSGSPVIERWAGSRWRSSPVPRGLTGGIFDISADSSTDAWAIGLDGFVLHWRGSGWSVAKKFPESGLTRIVTGVTALSRTNVWVFGGPGAFPGVGTWHFNGHTWKQVTTAPGNGIVSASALSPVNMWAIGSVSAPEDSIIHFTGTWHQAKAPALSGLQFSDIVAVAKDSIWATASVQTNSFRPFVVHMTRSGWVRIKPPWSVVLERLAPDGHGGLWITAVNSKGPWVIHRSASGRWSRTLLKSSMIGITLIPGTTALWGAGSVVRKPGLNAAIFAFGRVR